MASVFKQQYTIKDTRFILIVVIAALGAFSGLGCSIDNDNLTAVEKSKFVDEIAAVRYMEIKNPDLQAADYFHSNEIPAIRIQSSGTVEGLLIIETETKQIVRGENLKLRPGKLFYQPLLNLSPGDYIAYIRGPGVAHNTSCKFTILDD